MVSLPLDLSSDRALFESEIGTLTVPAFLALAEPEALPVTVTFPGPLTFTLRWALPPRARAARSDFVNFLTLRIEAAATSVPRSPLPRAGVPGGEATGPLQASLWH